MVRYAPAIATNPKIPQRYGVKSFTRPVGTNVILGLYKVTVVLFTTLDAVQAYHKPFALITVQNSSTPLFSSVIEYLGLL